jgi:hypothetical protein
VENFGVIGLYFFEDEDGRAITAISARYVDMLRNFFTPELSRRGFGFSAIWFSQDGATTHTARAPEEFVREMLPENIVSLNGEFHGLDFRLISLPVIISFMGTSKQKSTSLDQRPSMTSRSQFEGKFQRYQKTWRGER